MGPMGRRGLFGARMDPPGDFAPDNRFPEGSGPVQRDATIPTYKKPSTANLIIGTIGDTLSQLGGGQGTYLPGLARQRELAQRAELQRQRQYDPQHVGNSIVRMNPQTGQYETIYSAPSSAAQGTALQQNYEWLKSVNPAAAESYLSAQTTAPPIVQTNPDGTKTIYPAGQVPRAAAPSVPLKPVGRLTPIQGGAAPNGSRPF